jgi:membrane glycosyltransferase
MDGLTDLRTEYLPPEAPLAMPVRALGTAPPNSIAPASSPPRIGLRRFFVIGGAILMTAAAAREMVLVLNVSGITLLEVIILGMFVSLFAWIALAFFTSLVGFFSVMRGRPGLDIDPGPELPVVHGRTALLMPVYNEAPMRTMAGLQVIHESLVETGQRDRFDIFILSDTTDADAWIAEEAAFLALRARVGDAGLYYRRRVKNFERKAGNIAEWVGRFGAAYPQMLILDADSVMTGSAIVKLVGAMERNPAIGLIQSLPLIVGGNSLFARMQQFAGRVYGPLIAHGIAWWHGAEGNYWGHNAVIRTQAFADAAGLPTLTGRKPFGGHILSHDFVEAALLRRAGWGIHMVPGLPGSYEEGPTSLPDMAVRDRRWCQGNLQHLAVLPGRGLHWVSRMHLLMGVGSYITAPIWLMFMVAGMLLSLQARFLPPDYFPQGRSLFPTWPVVDPVRSMWLFIGTMTVLLVPKIFAWIALLFDPAARRGCGGAVAALASIVAETLISGLLAPITMLRQSRDIVSILAGRDGGWQPQSRDGGGLVLGDLVKQYWAATLFGAVMGLAAFLVSPSLSLWMSPVWVGLLLAVPTVAITAGRKPGSLLRAVRLLAIPEERTPPPELVRRAEIMKQLLAERAPEPGALRRLVAEPGLLKAHLQMLPPPRRPRADPFDPVLLVGLAKLDEARTLDEAQSTLSPKETAAVLADRTGVARIMALCQTATI